MANKKCFKSDETIEEEKLMLAELKLLKTQFQTLKEEEERSSNKFSFRDYFPSYDVDSKTYQNNLQTPKKSRNIFEEKPLEPKPKHDFDFTPLGRSYESTLEELLQKKLILLPKVTLMGVSFMSNYCAYHRHNRHETLDCMELKNQIQDLIDDGMIRITTEDSTLKKD